MQKVSAAVAATPDTGPSRGVPWALCLSALGVVYGDIGTSPLYALRECFVGEHPMPVTPENVMGVLSLIFWALTLVVTLKYLMYVLPADNRGEGGVLALMALALDGRKVGRRTLVLTAIGLFGAALLYGDGMITPAISVLSAVEGLHLATPALSHYVVPITLAILSGLFLVQRVGTAKVGAVFGPIMLLWFGTLTVLGLRQLLHHPSVLYALSPHYAVRFFWHNGTTGFLVLGAVFLVVTGGEALYADMGHFGARPIRLTWLALVVPALLVNYFGQGALLITSPLSVENPFYRLAPSWALVPLLFLATMATIIASQAVISGAYSLTRQAIMLGYWPRSQVRHTSAHEVGQIYVPSINWLLMIATLALVIGFRSSSALASAYGIAVTTTMVITTLLAYQVARHRWHWKLHWALLLTAGLLTIDLAFFGANAAKIEHGGWVPLLVAGIIYLSMATWKRGRQLVGERIRATIVPLEDFFELLRLERPERPPGTAVFMTSNAQGTPPALLQNFLHNRVVHEQVVLMNVSITDNAYEPEGERVTIEDLPMGFVRVIARFGFMDDADVPKLLEKHGIPGWSLDHTTFFLGRETVLAEGRSGMTRWRELWFAFMSRNAQGATTFFALPPDRVVELGSQIAI